MLLGVASRFLRGELRNAIDLLYYREIATLGRLRIEGDPAALRASLRPFLVSDVLVADPAVHRRIRRGKGANALYYGMYVCFLIGVIAAVVVMAITPERPPLWGV